MIEDGTMGWGDKGPRPTAEGFNMEARQQSIYEWVRQLRGGVLGGAFTIERHLSTAIIYYLLGNRVNRSEVQAVFDEGLLAQLSFERRINLAVLIAPNFMVEDDIKTFKGDLNELRTIRNSMAHKPFWFHPKLNEKGEVFNLVPMIQRGKAQIALTTPFTIELNDKIASLIERSSRLANAVIEREAEQQTVVDSS